MSDDQFVVATLIMGSVSATVSLTIYFALKKKGYNVQTRKFAYLLGLGCGLIFVVPVFWFTDIPLKWKIMGSLLILITPLARLLPVDLLSDTINKARGKDKKGGEDR